MNEGGGAAAMDASEAAPAMPAAAMAMKFAGGGSVFAELMARAVFTTACATAAALEAAKLAAAAS